ncbi:MAG: YhbY family RNA-binding protein [Halobacteriales archaeon]|nr:YhbY family RNA-binding protein [Halobacteriales archaeon]
MNDEEARKAAHELDATVRVGKGGVDSVADELADQLANDEPVKVKFLRSGRGGRDTDTEDVAQELAEEAGARLVETRGHTAVYVRER